VDSVLWGILGLIAVNLGFWLLFTKPAMEDSWRAEPQSGGGKEEGGEDQLTAVLEVREGGSFLEVGGRRIPLKAQDHRVLGEAGLYLAPGYRLRVRGQVDESFVVAAGVLAALGVAVLFEEAA